MALAHTTCRAGHCPDCGEPFPCSVNGTARARTMCALTDLERRIYLAIVRSVREHGYAPTYSEMGITASLSTIHAAIRGLARKGLVAVAPGVPRGLRLLGEVS